MMKNYSFVVSYDGTDYFGWQEQKKLPTVTSALKKAFTFAFERKITLLGASRTDAGVHAKGQVGWFKTDLNLSAEKIMWVWNNVLPDDIRIDSLKEVDISFHPYYNVNQKVYHYHFFTDRPSPFVQRYGWNYPYQLDHAKLNEALQFFVGTHDFCSFRNAEDDRENTIRTIDAIDLSYIDEWNAYRITVKGQKFMRHMIRRIVGASLAVATKEQCPIAMLKKVMEARNPNHSLPNAPAKGLMLYSITYKCKD